ncbi:C2H2 type zinc-finger-domain-containing protein [Xylariomycetidae sp. FL2044]|nr:C2H2 type zinc-finger-domain-containing protein [Xylariomycetidae sp. FL2044]
MLGTTTATTATTTTTTTTPSMNLSTSPKLDSISATSKTSHDSPIPTMQPFTPGQCLFCPEPSPSFTDSVVHMQSSHSLFVPYRQHLLVDLESLFKYMHLVIFGYRECLHCGTERATVQAVQQHMTGKGHCKFDIVEPDSEFADFYDFSEPEGGEGSDDDDAECDSDGDSVASKNEEGLTTSVRQNPVPADEESICLPSGKIISKHSSTPAGPSFTQPRRRKRKPASLLEHSVAMAEEKEEDEEDTSHQESSPGTPDTRILSKRERREKTTVTYQLANLSANDRNSLVHLPASQQRAVLAAQFRNAVKRQKDERRRRGKIDRKGNKNLYAYWHTETPVYQCG